MSDEGIKKALLKCAVGFDTSEIVEEYTVDEGVAKIRVPYSMYDASSED